MNKIRKIIIVILLLGLSACATQKNQSKASIDLPDIDKGITDAELFQNNALSAPDMLKEKNGKTIKLARMMEGGACKNKYQGVFGTFKLYANSEDIRRIKQDQGSGVFSNFELLINKFSMLALQQTVDELDFQDDISTHNATDQQQLIKEFTRLFSKLIADDISIFEDETTLTIDVKPLPGSLFIYLKGCEIQHEH